MGMHRPRLGQQLGRLLRLLSPVFLGFLPWSPVLIAAPTQPLVFIHGIKGGLLQTDDGELTWLTAWEALALQTPVLKLPLTFNNGIQAKDHLHAAGVLGEVTLVPHFFAVDVYGPFLKQLPSLASDTSSFAYDWRRDNSETVEDFCKYLAYVSDKHNGAKVSVIAHSMGGLIAFAALNRHPELFARVVFAGVPFAGGIGFLPDLQEGTKTGLNGKVLSPDVLASFPSVYSLFPAQSGALLSAKGEALPVDFYNADDWRRLELGPYAPGRGDAAMTAFLPQALQAAKAFRQLLIKTAIVYPPILVVRSHAHPTEVKAIQGGPKAAMGWDFASATKEPGDSLVAAQHAQPPAGIPFKEVETSWDHVHMLGDPVVISAVKEFLKP